MLVRAGSTSCAGRLLDPGHARQSDWALLEGDYVLGDQACVQGACRTGKRLHSLRLGTVLIACGMGLHGAAVQGIVLGQGVSWHQAACALQGRAGGADWVVRVLEWFACTR